MANTPKPYEAPLAPELAEDILNTVMDASPEEPPRTIGERLQRAVRAVREANEYLAQSPVAKVLARSLMLELKKRGTPSLQVRPDGQIVLRVVYGKGVSEPKAVVKQEGNVHSAHRSDLPLLDDLREEAKVLGVDIEDLGRARRKIFERIEKARTTLRSGMDEVTVSPAPEGTLVATRRKKKSSDNGTPPTQSSRSSLVVTPTEEVELDELLGA